MELYKSQALSLRGEVIGIYERKGRRIAKIVLGPSNLLDVAAVAGPRPG